MGLQDKVRTFRILIENTAGAEFSLGGKLEQVAELVERLRACAPVAVCLDTCHVHVAGYDIVSEDGYIETMKLVEATVGTDAVKVWHCNDAKAPFGSKLDRHEHIGEGTIGAAAFRRLLHDERFAHCAFIAEGAGGSSQAMRQGMLGVLRDAGCRVSNSYLIWSYVMELVQIERLNGTHNSQRRKRYQIQLHLVLKPFGNAKQSTQ